MKPKDAHSQRLRVNWQSFFQHGFVVSAGNDEFWVGYGAPKKSTEALRTQVCLFSPDFYLQDDKPWFVFPYVKRLSRDELVSGITGSSNFVSQLFDWELPSKDSYLKQFKKVQSQIAADKIEKAVPVIFSKSQPAYLQEELPRLLLSALKQDHLQLYGFWSTQNGLLGLTPEVLFECDPKDKVLRTMALAGTRSSEDEAVNSLMDDAKEMKEHNFVVQGLWQKLKAFGNLNITPTHVWKLGSICHLRTDFEFKMHSESISPEQYLESVLMLHPTAALGVSPVNLELAACLEFEGNFDRGAFGAPFGVWDPAGASKCLVAIRNIMWSKDTAYIGTGCGVVKESEFEKEWQEHQLKRKFVRELFGV